IGGIQMNVRPHRAAVSKAERSRYIVAASDAHGRRHPVIAIVALPHILANAGIQLHGRLTESPLDCFLDRHSFSIRQLKVTDELRKQVVVIDVVHEHGRLRVEPASTVPALVVSARLLLHAEEVSDRYQSSTRKCAVGFFAYFSNSGFLAVDLDRSEVLG